nr:ABC transporter substrate-binding protein [uncultured Desulfobacter sp.]
MKLFFQILMLAALMGIGAGCEKTEPVHPSGQIIKIGVIGPLSGPYEYMGQSALKGIKTIMKMTPLLNNGDKIELVTANDMNAPGLALQSLEKLTQVDKVSAVLILSQSSPVLGAAKIADRFKTPILATVASHPGITAESEFISQLCFDDNFQGMVGALLARDELLIDNAVVVSEVHNPSSSFLAERFSQKFKALGGRIIMTLKLNPAMEMGAALLRHV